MAPPHLDRTTASTRYGYSQPTTSSSSNPDSSLPVPTEDRLNDTTLQQFNQIANTDVEMQPPLEERTTFLVIDTNILLHHFDVLVQFVADVESTDAPVVIVVPGVVIRELDGHKNNPELRWFASTSSTWLLKKAREHQKVRGQSSGETKRKSKNWRVKARDEDQPERLGDYLILDCCMYYASLGPRTVLWSGDYNLCFEAQAERLGTIDNDPNVRRRWSSRFLIEALFPGAVPDVGAFEGEQVHFNRKTVIIDEEEAKATVDMDPDAMDVDNTPNHGVVMTRFDVRDDLHRQTRNHFTMLLQDLVDTVGGKEIRRHQASGAAPSRYAPEWQKNAKPVSKWLAVDCLEYLGAQRRMPGTSPRLEVFLREPYSGGGARRGQDWSRADWQVAIGNLKWLGREWKDEVFGESADTLDALLGDVFSQNIVL